MIDIKTGTYTIKRFKKGYWDNSTGKYSRDEDKEFEIDASIQPITGNDVKLLPEHRRNTESIMIFSNERLFPSDEKSQKAADIVIYDEKRFEVFKSSKWSETTDINHYETIAIMEDGEGGGHVT